jgi:hypothetical protein
MPEYSGVFLIVFRAGDIGLGEVMEV